MIFSVKNLGPLQEAQVDLSRDLIILTGPNGSGKTYFAWSVYGLFRSAFRMQYSTERLKPCIDMVLETGELNIRELVREYGQDFATQQALEYAGEVHRVFAEPPMSFTRAGFALNLSEIHDVNGGFDAGKRHVVHVYELGDVGDEGTFMASRDGEICKFGFIGEESSIEEYQDVLRNVGPGIYDRDRARLSTMSADARAAIPWGMVLADLMADGLFQRCMIFPAERIATSIFAKELSLRRFDLVEEVLAAEDAEGEVEPVSARVRQSAQRYPWPIRDSLRVASDLERLSRQRSKFKDLSAELEETIVGGKVKIGQYGQLAFSPTGAPELELGAHVTASVVKSLSSLVFYFRHLARPGDFIIIDEPELNLHPDNQRKVARFLAKAVNRGFKIMISSHSDYLMRELNNLIMLGQPTEEAKQLRERLGYDEDSLLRPEQLGVYLFKDGRSHDVEVTETGFEIETIDSEINRLNEVSQEIYASLFDGDVDEP